ncbi:protein diaphanous homolog 1-like [Saccopteryx bilineata]|uniref:protein diaphanous homolog 1-like n=1 Tax=Saccopteryx bilineata TaxID=59482 RepID=UPI00338E04E4
MQTCREPARGLPAEAQGEDCRSCGVPRPGSAALRPPPPPLPPAGCCVSRGACSIGPPKPAAGGNRRKVTWARGGAGTIRCPRTWPGNTGGRSAARSPGARQPVRARRARVQVPGDCAAPLRSCGQAPLAPRLAPNRRWMRPPPNASSEVQCGERRGDSEADFHMRPDPDPSGNPIWHQWLEY